MYFIGVYFGGVFWRLSSEGKGSLYEYELMTYVDTHLLNAYFLEDKLVWIHTVKHYAD